jgi:hypothetical protein
MSSASNRYPLLIRYSFNGRFSNVTEPSVATTTKRILYFVSISVTKNRARFFYSIRSELPAHPEQPASLGVKFTGRRYDPRTGETVSE